MQCQMWVKKQLSNDISFIIVHYILIKFSKQDQMWAKKSYLMIPHSSLYRTHQLIKGDVDNRGNIYN